MQVNGNTAPKSIVIGVADPVPLWGRQNLRPREREWSEMLPGFYRQHATKELDVNKGDPSGSGASL
jgi:hypothetical protein